MNPDQPRILVLSRKKPHLIFLMGLAVLSGISLAVEGGTDDPVPTWLVRLWAAFLFSTGLIALISHLQKWDRERGMHVERGALIMQAAAVLCYVMCLPVYLGWEIGPILSIIAGIWWAGTNYWEVRLIGQDLKMISAVRRVTPRTTDDSSAP